jgi:hypothetical protein
VVRGYDPSRGDFVAGAFSQYGMRTLFFGVDHKESRAYIEENWLDGDDALEQLSNTATDGGPVGASVGPWRKAGMTALAGVWNNARGSPDAKSLRGQRNG